MAPTQKEQIEKLSAENSELRNLVGKLTERVDKLEASLEVLTSNQDETLTRLEGVEDNLCQVTSEQLELQRDQADLAVRLEAQQMYSRKQTLLLTGQAVEPQARGENIRQYVIHLLKEHLGITGIQPHDICACHRLRNPKVILVRFVALDDAERVYRERTKPKKRGLLVFESLTSERLSTISVLRDLKKAANSSVHSYYTQGGRIFVRTSENKEVKPTEIPFGASKQQIKDLCTGKQVTITPMDIRDHVRQANPVSASGQVRNQASRTHGDGAWHKVPAKRNACVSGEAAAPQQSPTEQATDQARRPE